MPYYVSPEQVMKDKADYARKGIARGRSVVVLVYSDGILFVAENSSRALHKVSEIYDRIAFAAVGKYNEFENLRVAGVRLADLRGYSYDRRDVTGRALANAYAQTLGTIFTETPKPYEVEIVVAEVGETGADDQLYRLTFDGSVADEHGFVAMGGAAEPMAATLRAEHTDGMSLTDALALAVRALATHDGQVRELPAGQLEVALLDRTRPQRTFRRLLGPQLERLLGAPVGASTDGPPGKDGDGSGASAGAGPDEGSPGLAHLTPVDAPVPDPSVPDPSVPDGPAADTTTVEPPPAG